MMKKTNEKKVLHKVKKRWVILGTALFALTAAGAYPETANADTANNHSFTQSSTTASNANQSTVTGSASATSNPSASSSTTPSSSSANNSSTTTTTQSSGSASSSDVTSGSSSATSSSSSDSSSATSTAQNGELLYRAGEDETNNNSNVRSTSATNVSLVDSEPSTDSGYTASGFMTEQDNHYTIGTQISGNDNVTYHTSVVDSNFYIQFANDSKQNSPITGITNLEQHYLPSGGSESSSSVDVSSYATFTANFSSTSSENINVSDANGDGNIASYASKLSLSGNPLSATYNNGDKIWWTFDVDPNSSFSASKPNTRYTTPAPTTNTPLKIIFLDDKGSSISSDKWITGDNIYPNNTFSVETSAVSGYHFVNSYSTSAGAGVSATPSGNAIISGTFLNWGDGSILLGYAKNQITVYNDSSTSYPDGLSKSDFQKTFTRNINLTDSSTNQSIKAPASQTVTYNRSGAYDEVTKTTSYGNWTTNDGSFAEYTAPSINGYNDPQPASVAASSVDVDTQPSSTSTDIKYTKSVTTNFSGNVKYIDTDEQNNEITSGETFNGPSGATVDYSTQNVVNSLTSKGYSLISDSPAPSASIIINSSSNDYTFKFTHKTSATSESKTFTRNINFIDSSTNQSIQTPANQTVTYNRSGAYDEVTKTTSYGNWTTNDGSFSEYTAPSISGYNNPQPASIAASSVDADNQSAAISTDIKYTKSVAATFSGSVKYIDTDNQNSEIASNENFNGNSGATVDYSTQNVVNSLTSKGYSLTSDSPAPSTSIIINSSSNNYTFKFTHKTSATSESKTFTRTINFIDSSTGQSIQAPASQTVAYTRGGTYDEVTKQSSYGNWTTNDGSFAEYTAPSVSGYNDPQPTSIAASSVDVDAQPSSTSTDIKYTKSVAATFSGSIKYIDANNGNQEIPGANSYGFNGTVSDKVNYSTQNIVDSLTSEGYSLTSDSPAPSASIIINSSSNDYTFKFTHKTSSTSESKTFTRNINFIDSSTGQSIQAPASQTVTYNRSGAYDEVTKTTSYGNWTTNDGSFVEYTTPSISGYNDPQPASVAASSVDVDNQPASTSADIKYTKSVAATFSGSVKYIDANNGNQEIPGANSYGFNGTVGDKVNYSTQSVVNSLTSKGYSLVNGAPATSDNIIVNSSNNDYTFQFVHKIDTYFANSTSYPDGLVKLDFEKTFTRNINFVDSSNGQPIQSSAVQTVTHSRSATYDEVTNATSYSDWKTSNGSFPEYAAPSISGYNNPQPASVPASSVSDTDAQSTSTSIEYTKSSSAPSQTPSSSVPSSSAAIPSFAPVPTSIQSFSSAGSYQSSNSSSVTSTIVSSANSSAEQVVVASVATKMYNNQTQLVKSGNQILIYIEPRYANNTGVASATDSYVVNIQNSDGTVSHDQLVTLDQYNAMLIASGKAPYTPEDIQQAYNERKNNQGILDNDEHKTTFDARTVQKGNDTFIFTDNKNSKGDFKRPKDGKLVLKKGKKKHSHKSNKHSFKNKKKQIKNKRNHMKTKHHHTKKNHSHHKK